MADVNPTEPRPREADEEMGMGAANAAASSTMGSTGAGAMGGTAAGAVAGQIAADDEIDDELGNRSAYRTEDTADSGDSFAGEGSPGPEPYSPGGD